MYVRYNELCRFQNLCICAIASRLHATHQTILQEISREKISANVQAKIDDFANNIFANQCYCPIFVN